MKKESHFKIREENNSDITVWKRPFYGSTQYNLRYNFQIIYVTKGQANVTLLKKEYPLEEGDMAVIFPMLAYSLTEIEGCEYMFFTCYPDVLLRSVRPIIKNTCPETPIIKAKDLNPHFVKLMYSLLYFDKNAFLSENDTPIASNGDKGTVEISGIENKHGKIINNEAQYFYKDQNLGFYYANTLANLLVALSIKELRLKPIPENYHQDLKFKVISYISEHYKEDISLESISTTLNINKYTVSRVLSKELEMSFYDILNNIRITEAKELLSRTDMSIIDISYDVGYNYLYTFDRIFKKLTGMSPKDYRKKFSI